MYLEHFHEPLRDEDNHVVLVNQVQFGKAVDDLAKVKHFKLSFLSSHLIVLQEVRIDKLANFLDILRFDAVFTDNFGQNCHILRSQLYSAIYRKLLCQKFLNQRPDFRNFLILLTLIKRLLHQPV